MFVLSIFVAAVISVIIPSASSADDFHCPSNYFKCSTATSLELCIPVEWVCDKEKIWDCPDGSDEVNCSSQLKSLSSHINHSLQLYKSSLLKEKDQNQQQQQKNQKKTRRPHKPRPPRPTLDEDKISAFDFSTTSGILLIAIIVLLVIGGIIFVACYIQIKRNQVEDDYDVDI